MGAASSLISLYNNKTPNLISIMSNVRELLCTSALIYEKTTIFYQNTNLMKLSHLIIDLHHHFLLF